MSKYHHLLQSRLSSLGLSKSELPHSKESWNYLLESIEKSFIHLEQELQNLQNQLEIQKKTVSRTSKMATLGEMAGNIAHEINTPLTTIAILSQSVSRQTNLAQPSIVKIADAAMKIETVTARIARIASGLRTFSRDSDSEPMAVTSLRSIVEDTLDFCNEKFRMNQIPLYCQIDQSHFINCRPVQMSQVLLNLISNSFDAIVGTNEPWVKIESSLQDSNLCIRVLDSGKGISTELANRIMEPLFTTKPAGKGTGLGLSISKSIIEAHQGRLEIEQNNRHTCFIITLPLPIQQGRALTAA